MRDHIVQYDEMAAQALPEEEDRAREQTRSTQHGEARVLHPRPSIQGRAHQRQSPTDHVGNRRQARPARNPVLTKRLARNTQRQSEPTAKVEVDWSREVRRGPYVLSPREAMEQAQRDGSRSSFAVFDDIKRQKSRGQIAKMKALIRERALAAAGKKFNPVTGQWE